MTSETNQPLAREMSRWEAIRVCWFQGIHILLGGTTQVHVINKPTGGLPSVHVVTYDSASRKRFLVVRRQMLAGGEKLG